MQENNNEEKKEKTIDIKGTLQEFIEEEPQEISQEEAIESYKEGDIIEYKPKKRKKNEEDDENEDDEHLKRIKRELLESLKRVDMMEKKIFEEKEDSLKNIKVKSGSQKAQEKEKVIDKTQLIFSSDNMSVANIVGDGKTILAGTGGTATITVRSLDGTIHDSINVTVLARPKEFSIPHELTLTLGSEEVSTITPTVQPEDFDYSGCEYSSSNEGVVTVDQDGNLTPVSAGTASVYAKLPKLNIERECKVTVIAPIEKITLSKSDASINAGEMVKLSCTTYPETPDTSILQWSTSDSSIAAVDASGTVTGVGKGIAFIKVSYKDVYAVCAVSVNKKESETKTDGSLPQGSGAHNDWYRHGDSSTFDALLKAVNKYRQDNGILALQKASSLTAVANQRADSMVDGSNTASGYKELLAQNGRAAIDVAQAWYNTDYYRSLMLDSSVTTCGIAVDYDGDGCSMWVMILS
mgnify:CR=1 FL=1